MGPGGMGPGGPNPGGLNPDGMAPAGAGRRAPGANGRVPPGGWTRRRPRDGLAPADPPDRAQELAGVGGPQPGVPAGGQRDQGVQGVRQPGLRAGGRRDGLVHVLVGHGERGFAGVRLLPGEQLEQHDTGRVDIAAGIAHVAGDLLGSQVRDGAHEHARLGVVRARQAPGQAEVGDLDPAVLRQQHVLRLDVPVHDPGLVRCGQAGQHALDDVERLPGGELPALVSSCRSVRPGTYSIARYRCPLSDPWS